jgi:hypothetical protein
MMLALGVNFLIGGMLGATIGISPLLGGTVLIAVALVSPLFGLSSLVREGIYTEVWTGETIKAFRSSIESIGWLNRIRSYDQYVNNEVIHFVQLGGDPTVLINNTTYPLAIETLSDADKAISLDKYQTKPTRITDDELYAISYDKMASIIERHRDAVNETKYAKALAALAPNANTTLTPAILTSGEVSAEDARKRITRADIIALKKKFDIQKVPTSGRILVLCPDHVNDLLLFDQKFIEQYYNYTTGKISNIYGFEVYEYANPPYYTVSALAKLPWGSVPSTGTDRQASVAFYAPRMMKATGPTKVYLSRAADDPTTQENLYNLRHLFICLPLKNESIGAIVSDIPASGK